MSFRCDSKIPANNIIVMNKQISGLGVPNYAKRKFISKKS